MQVTGTSRKEEMKTGRAEWLPFLLEERLKLAGARFQFAEGDGIPHAVKSGCAFILKDFPYLCLIQAPAWRAMMNSPDLAMDMVHTQSCRGQH